MVSFAKQETEIENTYGSVRPARPPEAKILRRQLQKKISDVVAHRRACLLEFWIKFSGGFIDSKNVFSDAEVLKM